MTFSPKVSRRRVMQAAAALFVSRYDMGTTPNSNPTASTGQPSLPVDDGIGTMTPGKVSFRYKGVQPPSDIYIQTDDQLLIIPTFNGAFGTYLRVAGRILEPSGRIVAFASVLNNGAQLANGIWAVGLSEGYLLSVTVTSEPVADRRGLVYVQVFVGRGQPASPVTFALLTADYVSTTNPIGWPNGRTVGAAEGPGDVESITLEFPPNNQGGIVNPDPNTTVVVHAIAFQLETSAVAGVRTLSVILGGSGEVGLPYHYTLPAAFAASETYVVDLAVGLGFQGALQPDNSIVCGIPYLKLNAISGYGVEIGNAQAGDVIPNVAFIRETWLTN